MPDEAQWRRPGAHGREIVLADGQKWLFRPPVLELRATVDESGVARFSEKIRVDPLIDRFVEAEPNTLEETEALLNVALAMLQPNYDLTPIEMVNLLVWRNDDANAAMWRAIGEHALGIAPKPTPVGSAPPSSPTG